MEFKSKTIAGTKEILYNDHYVGIPYNCTDLSGLAVSGVIKAGTIIPSNDSAAQGVLLSDVVLAENPNGTLVVHGFIKQAALPTAPTEEAAKSLIGKGVQFIV